MVSLTKLLTMGLISTSGPSSGAFTPLDFCTLCNFFEDLADFFWQGSAYDPASVWPPPNYLISSYHQFHPSVIPVALSLSCQRNGRYDLLCLNLHHLRTRFRIVTKEVIINEFRLKTFNFIILRHGLT